VTNNLGQPIGLTLAGWTPRPRPPSTPIDGQYCRIVPLDREAHARDLYAANAEDANGRMWTYLPFGPFSSFDAYEQAIDGWMARDDWQTYAILDPAGRAAGVASYMRIDPAGGSIEVGGIMYSPRLRRTRSATEAMFLMMRRVFDDLGYRRYEWKCDALNEPSIRAATRLGFRYEGTFRQATVVKGRNRDTAWFSIIDREWPYLKAAFMAWLAPANFENDGKQRRSLTEMRTELTSY
jgi:RimJ/RimL family protein N-acetyltransferase